MIIDEDVRTTSVDEAEALLARVYTRCRLLESDDPFVFEQAVRGDERVGIHRYRIASRTEAEVEIDGVVGIGTRLGGSYRAVSNGTEVDAARAFLLGPGAARSWSESLDLVMVNVGLAALAEVAGAPGDRPPKLLVGGLGPASPDLQRQWDATQRFATEMWSDPRFLSEQLLRRSVGDLLLASVLACFAVEVVVPPEHGQLGLPASLRRAVQFIEDNADRPIGVRDIAEAARLSPRGVQDLFHRTFGISPTAYLRTVRLDAARRDLQAANPDTDTVAAVAARWGFGHLPRFAARYREAFGENPSRTLRG
jgi:AraC-like DNA-binding protein